MKKLILSAMLGLLSLTPANAQEMKVSAQVGATIGDASEVFGLNYGADFTYLFEIFEGFSVGGKAGIDIYSGKEWMNSNVKFTDLTLIPITASAQYNFTPDFFAAADLGYALSLNNDYDGGFYFMPKGGWQNEYIQVYGYLKGISSKIDGGLNIADNTVGAFNNTMAIGAGFAYKF